MPSLRIYKTAVMPSQDTFQLRDDHWKTGEPNTVDIMVSVYSVLYTLVLFSELSSHLVTVAIPAAQVEDGILEQDGLFLGDEPSVVEPALVPSAYRRSLVLDTNARDEDGSPKFIVISDIRPRGHGARGLNPAFSQKLDRRNTDIEMLRCMIGRVYRPCWEI